MHCLVMQSNNITISISFNYFINNISKVEKLINNTLPQITNFGNYKVSTSIAR